MMGKFLKEKAEISLQEIPYGPGNPIELEYYLVESKVENIDGLIGQNEYGVEIVKKECGCTKEIKTVKGVSCSRESAENLLKALALNTVTPVSLGDVLDDIIGI